MGACRLLLLGPPLVQREDGTAPIRLRKVLALAAYLAVEGRAFSREYLAALLWPEFGQHRALANLRRMLTRLRDALGDRCIRTDADLVQLEPASVEVDVTAFESLLHQHAADSDVDVLEAAAALYRGSFLEGFVLGDCLEFDEWQDGVRRRMQEQFDGLLERLCRAHLRADRAGSALPFARRWLELDGLNEAAHRMLMEIHARTGRVDLVRRQYEACARILKREGLEPDGETRDLHAAIAGGRFAGARPAIPRAGFRAPRRRSWRWAVPLAAVLLAVASIAAAWYNRRLYFGGNLSVQFVEPVLARKGFDGLRIRFRNDGAARPAVGYTITFSSDSAVVTARDYVVYADEIRMGRDREAIVEVDRKSGIQRYLEANGVRIPPGIYSLKVTIDPAERIHEDSELDNRLANGVRFFDPGTAPEAAFVLEVVYRGDGQLDDENPLRIYVGEPTASIEREELWARFVAAREGTYFLPVDDIPARGDGESGYIMVVIHDVGGDLEVPSFPGPGDVGAIYRGDVAGFCYGVFNAASGVPIRPGRGYHVEFAPPPPPEDDFELDDHKEIGTVIDYADLPVRQRHTFHGEGTGDTDEDWFRVQLGAGETITVETFPSEGSWGCDTAIDVADARKYIRTANDKSQFDFYSLLTHTNDTGIRQTFFFQVKPWAKYTSGVNRFADYIVEFRR